jgi:hypothetical protein
MEDNSMRCPGLERLQECLYGYLGNDAQKEILEHTLGCNICRGILNRLEEERRILEAAILREVPEKGLIKERMLKRGTSTGRQVRHVLRLPRIAAVILIALGVLFVAWWLSLPQAIQEVPIPWDKFPKRWTELARGYLKATPETEYEIKRDSIIVLNRGALWLDIKGQDDPFWIETPAGKVIVKGTEFVVQVLKREEKMKVLKSALAVLVISGMVELVTPVGRELAGAGEYLYAQQGEAPLKKLAGQKKPEQVTRAKFIIWGGLSCAIPPAPLNDGAIFDLKRRKWEEMPGDDEMPLVGRAFHTSVLAGKKLIILGRDGRDKFLG